MDKEIIVIGCKDCPFCFENDMGTNYFCSLEKDKSRMIRENSMGFPVTPFWCVLKTNSITVNMKIQ